MIVPAYRLLYSQADEEPPKANYVVIRARRRQRIPADAPEQAWAIASRESTYLPNFLETCEQYDALGTIYSWQLEWLTESRRVISSGQERIEPAGWIWSGVYLIRVPRWKPLQWYYDKAIEQIGCLGVNIKLDRTKDRRQALYWFGRFGQRLFRLPLLDIRPERMQQALSVRPLGARRLRYTGVYQRLEQIGSMRRSIQEKYLKLFRDAGGFELERNETERAADWEGLGLPPEQLSNLLNARGNPAEFARLYREYKVPTVTQCRAEIRALREELRQVRASKRKRPPTDMREWNCYFHFRRLAIEILRSNPVLRRLGRYIGGIDPDREPAQFVGALLHRPDLFDLYFDAYNVEVVGRTVIVPANP